MTDPAYLLDTNICIYVLRDADGPAARRLGTCAPGEAAASTVTLTEILRALPAGDGRERRQVDALFRLLGLLPFDEAAARICAAIPFKRGTYDRLIAAQALACDLVLVTNNERDFSDVSGLRIENWAIE